jgi:hypothetical protein
MIQRITTSKASGISLADRRRAAAARAAAIRLDRDRRAGQVLMHFLADAAGHQAEPLPSRSRRRRA